MTDQKILNKFLRENSIVSIASSYRNKPWIFTAFYVVLDETTPVFLSGPNTEHGKQIGNNPHVSASIYSKDSKPGYIEGAQVSGEIQNVKISEIPKLFLLYTKVFPIKILEMDLKDMIKSLDTKLYKLKIKRIKYRNDKKKRVRLDLKY